MLQKIAGNIRLAQPLSRVVLAGDPGCDGYNAEAAVVLEHILAIPADFHLLLGDLVPTGRERYFKQFAAIAEGGPEATVYCLSGNHDIQEYSQHCGRGDYFIKAPNALFIVLDNSRRYFTAETRAFLARTLAEEACPNVFIAFHIPPPNPFIPNNFSQEEWDKLRQILDPHQGRIRLIFCGHVHSAFEYTLDDLRVVVTGGAGSRLDNVGSDKLSSLTHHSCLLEFKGDDWRFSIVDVDRAEAAKAYWLGEDAKHILADLAEGFSGEAQAFRRYQLFAEAAQGEGFPEVAKLFRAAAASEFHHSRNMLVASEGLGKTLDNLEASAEREREEIEEIYPRFIKNAEPANSRRAAIAYDCALQAEKVHRRLFLEAVACLRQGKDLPPRKYFTCLRCGYTHDGDTAPNLCPACGADRFKFEEQA